MFLNKLVNKLSPYKTVSHRAWELISDDTVLKLDWNESTIAPSPLVIERIREFLDMNKLNWYPNVDNVKLREKLASYSKVDVGNIEYFSSSDALHEYILRAFLGEEDVVTMISPTYDNFRAVAESVGAKIDYYWLEKSKNYHFSIDDFTSHLDSVMPKAVYLCNPNNPTGNVYSTEQISYLLKRFNDVLFIIDEAYFEFNKQTGAHLVSNFENILICRTFSKAFGLASIRFGYAIASSKNIEGLKRVRNSKSVSSFAQVAAEAALDDIDYMEKYVESVLAAKKKLISHFQDLDINVYESSGGNFVFIDLKSLANDYVTLLSDRNVFIRSFSHMNNCDGLIRITVGNSEQVSRFMTHSSEVIHLIR
ncbi:pyridoxal phosphate-dependent aminotransferase [Shewanella algae]|uniref:pyridoxal phosphate-dependent aminotransferase n=1 Tax=Shewanella algae TaxID=38313 RepID=UPI001AAE5238|nr:histidinol-phosphate transaminase [Shewanella algae]MBO2590372.1 histidinol-phosphate aminotransferase family protein [Shewanella algae]